jgi:hypothetical protein
VAQAVRGGLWPDGLVSASRTQHRSREMLAPLDAGSTRRRIATVRRLLIARAARLTTTARQDRLHFAPAAAELIAQTLARIRAHRYALTA